MGLGAAAAFVAFAIGLTWMLVSGRFHRVEDKRFRLTIDQTRGMPVVSPEEFSDEVAATTPISVGAARR